MYPEDGGSRLFQNVGTYLQNYKASHFKRHESYIALSFGTWRRVVRQKFTNILDEHIASFVRVEE
jgi:hypothetical protein